VSIVIPCYNHARFLPDAIRSALTQSHDDVEVIVVDDGSTDDSARVAEGRGVRVVRQANQGLAAARNTGLAVSTGNMLIFLDADDRLRPDAARAGMAALQRRPDAMLALGRCLLIDEFGTPLATEQPRVTSGFYEELLRRNYIWTPALVAFRRRIFDEVGGFDPRVNPSADYDMYLRIARHHEFVPHDTVVAEYRQHGTSMSRNPVMMLDATLDVLRRQRIHAMRTPPTRKAYREGTRQWREWYGEHLVERFRAAIRTPGGQQEALRCAWHLLRLHPRGVAKHLWKKAVVATRAARRPFASRDGEGRANGFTQGNGATETSK
jgi:glycosyltransferase involved in cell wall biosynthesis